MQRSFLWEPPEMLFVCPSCDGKGEYVGLMEREELRAVRWARTRVGLARPGARQARPFLSRMTTPRRTAGATSERGIR